MEVIPETLPTPTPRASDVSFMYSRRRKGSKEVIDVDTVGTGNPSPNRQRWMMIDWDGWLILS